MKSFFQISLQDFPLLSLLLALLCCTSPSMADNYSDLKNAANKRDLKELSRILAIAYEFSIEDTHLTTLPAPIEEAVRRGSGFMDGACSLVGKPINLIKQTDNSGYAVTTANACHWKSKPVQSANGAVGPIWVVYNGENPKLVFVSEGRILEIDQTISKNGLPKITITSGVSGRFIDNAWTYDGKTYVSVNECGTDAAAASSYCLSRQKTKNLNTSEDRLNQTYKSLKEAISSPSFPVPNSTIRALISAERNWIKQRKLDCTTEYVLLNNSKEEKRQNFECLSRLADQRTTYLNEINDCIVSRGDIEHCPKTSNLSSSEDLLNQSYMALEKAISSPPFSAPKSAIRALISAERNWIKQRKLDCTTEYVLLNNPKEEKRQNFECLSRLAEQRTAYLNEIKYCIVGGGDLEHCPSY